VKIGYARVSTSDQNPQLQIEALEKAGVDEVVTEHASGKDRERPVLEATLARLDKGDTLVVWKLDRLGRSLIDLESTVNELSDRGVGFRSLTDGIDTSNGNSLTATLIRQILGAVAQFERALIRERVQNGVDAARKQGRVGGRPPQADRRRSRPTRGAVGPRRARGQAGREVERRQRHDLPGAQPGLGPTSGNHALSDRQRRVATSRWPACRSSCRCGCHRHLGRHGHDTSTRCASRAAARSGCRPLATSEVRG
jgi:DNA invertase Pin-like site-specific DNA recombinase